MGVRSFRPETSELQALPSSRDIKHITARLAPHDREDAEQEAALRLLQIAESKPVHQPVHLLRRIARNLTVDRLRQQKRTVGLDDIAAAPASTAPDPERSAISSQRLNMAMSIIQSMPARRREAFLLHRMDGLSYAQIARRMAISPKAVEKHMALAMVDLALGMEKLESPGVG